jgi:hypothetical protein
VTVAFDFVSKDQVLLTVNSLEILGIIYLAIAVSKLREHIARLEGRLERWRNGSDKEIVR